MEECRKVHSLGMTGNMLEGLITHISNAYLLQSKTGGTVSLQDPRELKQSLAATVIDVVDHVVNQLTGVDDAEMEVPITIIVGDARPTQQQPVDAGLQSVIMNYFAQADRGGVQGIPLSAVGPGGGVNIKDAPNLGGEKKVSNESVNEGGGITSSDLDEVVDVLENADTVVVGQKKDKKKFH
jgi:hypothetical protein